MIHFYKEEYYDAQKSIDLLMENKENDSNFVFMPVWNKFKENLDLIFSMHDPADFLNNLLQLLAELKSAFLSPSFKSTSEVLSYIFDSSFFSQLFIKNDLGIIISTSELVLSMFYRSDNKTKLAISLISKGLLHFTLSNLFCNNHKVVFLSMHILFYLIASDLFFCSLIYSTGLLSICLNLLAKYHPQIIQDSLYDNSHFSFSIKNQLKKILTQTSFIPMNPSNDNIIKEAHETAIFSIFLHYFRFHYGTFFNNLESTNKQKNYLKEYQSLLDEEPFKSYPISDLSLFNDFISKGFSTTDVVSYLFVLFNSGVQDVIYLDILNDSFLTQNFLIIHFLPYLQQIYSRAFISFQTDKSQTYYIHNILLSFDILLKSCVDFNLVEEDSSYEEDTKEEEENIKEENIKEENIKEDVKEIENEKNFIYRSEKNDIEMDKNDNQSMTNFIIQYIIPHTSTIMSMLSSEDSSIWKYSSKYLELLITFLHQNKMFSENFAKDIITFLTQILPTVSISKKVNLILPLLRSISKYPYLYLPPELISLLTNLLEYDDHYITETILSTFLFLFNHSQEWIQLFLSTDPDLSIFEELNNSPDNSISILSKSILSLISKCL